MQVERDVSQIGTGKQKMKGNGQEDVKVGEERLSQVQ